MSAIWHPPGIHQLARPVIEQGKYKVYNLCSERLYDASLFEGKVASFPFDDHNCPPVAMLATFCQSAYSWLKGGLDHVVVVHCKAGMARTGLMICCLLQFLKVCSPAAAEGEGGGERVLASAFTNQDPGGGALGSIMSGLRGGEGGVACTGGLVIALPFLEFYPTAEEAIEFYNAKRAVDGKALTLPSQLRYVKYYEKILRQHDGVTPPVRKCMLRGIRLLRCPYWIRPTITISTHEGVIFSTRTHPATRDLLPDDIWHNAPRKGVVVFALPGERCVVDLAGDFKILFQDRHGNFYCWLNTNFIETRQILPTSELDGFDKRSLGSPGFQVEVVVLDSNAPPPSSTIKPSPAAAPAAQASSRGASTSASTPTPTPTPIPTPLSGLGSAFQALVGAVGGVGGGGGGEKGALNKGGASDKSGGDGGGKGGKGVGGTTGGSASLAGKGKGRSASAGAAGAGGRAVGAEEEEGGRVRSKSSPGGAGRGGRGGPHRIGGEDEDDEALFTDSEDEGKSSRSRKLAAAGASGGSGGERDRAGRPNPLAAGAGAGAAGAGTSVGGGGGAAAGAFPASAPSFAPSSSSPAAGGSAAAGAAEGASSNPASAAHAPPSSSAAAPAGASSGSTTAAAPGGGAPAGASTFGGAFASALLMSSSVGSSIGSLGKNAMDSLGLTGGGGPGGSSTGVNSAGNSGPATPNLQGQPAPPATSSLTSAPALSLEADGGAAHPMTHDAKTSNAPEAARAAGGATGAGPGLGAGGLTGVQTGQDDGRGGKQREQQQEGEGEGEEEEEELPAWLQSSVSPSSAAAVSDFKVNAADSSVFTFGDEDDEDFDSD
eukprot:jgi/Mesen1/10325/ME000797S09809